MDTAIRFLLLVLAICFLSMFGGGCSVDPITVGPSDGSVDGRNDVTAADAVRSEVGIDGGGFPSCGPSPITIDYTCGRESGHRACYVASALASAPCRFTEQSGVWYWLVVNCSQCWGLE